MDKRVSKLNFIPSFVTQSFHIHFQLQGFLKSLELLWNSELIGLGEFNSHLKKTQKKFVGTNTYFWGFNSNF